MTKQGLSVFYLTSVRYLDTCLYQCFHECHIITTTINTRLIPVVLCLVRPEHVVNEEGMNNRNTHTHTHTHTVIFTPH